MNRMLLALALIAPLTASAVEVDLCVKINVQTTDSGRTANGISEDYWRGADGGTAYLVPAYGVRVRLSSPGWSVDLDADPRDGCVTADVPSANGLTVRIYAYSTDDHGNVIRVHDAGTDTSAWYPGSSISVAWSGQTLSTINMNEYVVNGRTDDRWTTMAVAAFSLYRVNDELYDKTISIGFSENNCNDSGSIHGSAEQYVESDGAHLFRIGRCASTSSDTREKMIISHELGHAVMRLSYGRDGDESPRSQTFSLPPPLPADPTCTNVASYGMNSLEFDSQVFKESFADFYSARVWNIKEARANYTYRSTPYDIETWDALNGTFDEGGYITNACNVAVSGVSTKGDWLRFLWDIYTTTCAAQPTFHDMVETYSAVRGNNDSGEFVLTNTNYEAAILYAIDNTVPGLSACERTRSHDYADWNAL
jgi:hypothetical protein